MISAIIAVSPLNLFKNEPVLALYTTIVWSLSHPIATSLSPEIEKAKQATPLSILPLNLCLTYIVVEFHINIRAFSPVSPVATWTPSGCNSIAVISC